MFDSVSEPSVRLRNTLLDACCRSGQIQAAWTVFNQIATKTSTSYTLMINALGRSGLTSQIDDLVKQMKAQGLPFSRITWSSIITAYGMGRDLHSMFRTFEEMQQAGVTPCDIDFGAMMAACARAGEKEKTAELFRQLQALGIQADRGHCTSLVVACARHKDEVGALTAFENYKKYSLKPDVVSYTSLMGCFAGESALARCEAILTEMTEIQLVPDTFVYNALAQAAIYSGKPQECRAYLDKLDALGLKRNSESALIESRVRQLEAELRSAAKRSSEATSSAQLPPGWREHVDAASGLPYYWKEEDPAGTTTWQRPV